MLVASIQMSVVENDKEATIAKAVNRIRQAAGADLIVLPEMWNIGFMSFDRYVPEAEGKTGPTLSALKGVAKELKVYLHTGSFVEKVESKYYNSSYLLSPQGEVLANYHKIHLFGYNSRENEILNRGDAVVVAETPLGNFGLATCYDLRFPELFRRMIEKGAHAFLITSAWPHPRLEHWNLLNRVRALENQSFLVSANAAGFNRDTRFVGHSMVVDPWGSVLASAAEHDFILRAETDLNEVGRAREQFPALVDRQAWLGNAV
jgi:predicted amidohydrolase